MGSEGWPKEDSTAPGAMDRKVSCALVTKGKGAAAACVTRRAKSSLCRKNWTSDVLPSTQRSVAVWYRQLKEEVFVSSSWEDCSATSRESSVRANTSWSKCSVTRPKFMSRSNDVTRGPATTYIQ